MPTTLLIIKNPNGEYLGTLECDKDGIRFVGEKYDEEFAHFFEKSIDNGLPILIESYEFANDNFVISQTIVPRNELKYYHVRDFLAANGYIVYEQDPLLAKEIMKLLEDLPDDDPDKKFISKNLSELTRLEQTTILEELKATQK
jgi:uncharacterized protein YqgQ